MSTLVAAARHARWSALAIRGQRALRPAAAARCSTAAQEKADDGGQGDAQHEEEEELRRRTAAWFPWTLACAREGFPHGIALPTAREGEPNEALEFRRLADFWAPGGFHRWTARAVGSLLIHRILSRNYWTRQFPAGCVQVGASHSSA